MCILISIFSLSARAADESTNPRGLSEFSLNGLHFAIDNKSGSILRMSTADIGNVLDASPDQAGIVDLAFPIKKFQPLRLASRYSENAGIKISAREATISWENLGASRNFDLPGSVAVSVHLQAAPDEKSVVMTCSIKNQSRLTIPQVMFPDLMGLIPFAGEDDTKFRTAAFEVAPFTLLKPDDETTAFYATGQLHKGDGWIEYKSGKYRSFSEKLVDWLDFGGVNN